MSEISQHNDAVSFGKDIISLMLLATAWLIVYFLIGLNKIDFIQGHNKSAQMFLFLFGFGIVHWKYSKIFAYLYSLNKKIIPFAPTISPRATQRLGQAVTVAGLVNFCVLVFKVVRDIDPIK